MKNLFTTLCLFLTFCFLINYNSESKAYTSTFTIKDTLKKGPIFLEINNFPIKKNKIILDTAIKKFFKRMKFSLLDEGEFQRMYEVAYKKAISPYTDKYGFVQNEEHLYRAMHSIEPFTRNVKLSIFSSDFLIDSINIVAQDSPGFTANTKKVESFSNTEKVVSRDYLLQILDSCERKKYFLMKNY
jgi:hypothetical protein